MQSTHILPTGDNTHLAPDSLTAPEIISPIKDCGTSPPVESVSDPKEATNG